MIKIIAVGKIKESYLKEAEQDYKKRLSKYTKIELIELADSDINSEKDLILKNINPRDYVITLEIEGVSITSLELSKKIDELFISNSTICFIIGGSNGLHDSIKQKSNYHLSFSSLTFPHQLFRVMLLEQIYRAYKINNNESYHK